jgi:hypothetical protein
LYISQLHKVMIQKRQKLKKQKHVHSYLNNCSRFYLISSASDTQNNIVMIWEYDYRGGIDLISDLLTSPGTTSTYSVISNLHTLQIAAANTKPPPACSVFNSRSLAASHAQVLLSQQPMPNSYQFPRLTTINKLWRHIFSASLTELDSSLPNLNSLSFILSQSQSQSHIATDGQSVSQ